MDLTQVTGHMHSLSHEEVGPSSKVEQTETPQPDQSNSILSNDENDQARSQNGEGQDDPDDDNDASDSQLLTAKKKKKKKKRKPKSQRGLTAPTGFEEYYVDTPLTPDQHAEEVKLYEKDLPFIDRIFTAIQRFEWTRRLVPERRDVFLKYLAYGSIDVGPRNFQSVNPKEAKQSGLGKEELAAMRTQISLTAELRNLDSPTSLYAVDFVGCAAGFLSRRAHDCFPMGTREEVEVITTTVERFMSYLLQHDVCPEHNTAILAARKIARTATTELWFISEAQRWLPGDFNKACSTLFDGRYARDFDGVHNWGTEEGKSTFVGFTQETANQIMSFGVAGAATEDVYQEFMRRAQDDSIEVLEVREQAGFEIIAIDPPTEECRELYRKQSSDFRPVGRVTAKPWTNPDTPSEDLTPKERLDIALTHPSLTRPHPEQYTFLIEEVVQRHLFIGMKLEATLHRLNCGGAGHRSGAGGLWFIDEVMRGYCSFDTFICNERMVGWKKPKPVPGALGVKHFLFPNTGYEEYLADLEVRDDEGEGENVDDDGGDEGGVEGAENGARGANGEEAEFEL